MGMYLFFAFIIALILGIMAGFYSFSLNDLLRYLKEKHPNKWQAMGSPTPFSWHSSMRFVGGRVLKFVFTQKSIQDPVLRKKFRRLKFVFFIFLVSIASM